MATEVKFGDWIGKAFELYKQNLAVLILASLVAGILSAVTFGILAGPMMAGLILIAIDLVDGKTPKPEMARLFNGFQFFAQSFLFCIVWGLLVGAGFVILSFIPCLGQIAAIVGALAICGLLMFGMFLIVDKGMAFWPASMESINRVKEQLFPLIGFAVVAYVLSSVGAILCGVGAFLTAPISVCMLVIAYREFFPAQGSVPQQAPTPTAPTSTPTNP